MVLLNCRYGTSVTHLFVIAGAVLCSRPAFSDEPAKPRDLAISPAAQPARAALQALADQLRAQSRGRGADVSEAAPRAQRHRMEVRSRKNTTPGIPSPWRSCRCRRSVNS